MKMRKKLAALLAVAMIASVMPMTAFAASRNRVNKTITVEKDSVIKEGYEPILSIKMDDELTTRQSFYLNLDGAEWLETEDLVERFATGKAAVKTGEDNIFHFEVSGYVFEAHREGGGTIAVRLLVAGTSVDGTETGKDVVTIIRPNANPNLNFEFKFPMATKVTGAEAIVEVQMYDTTITNNKHLFAVSDGVKSRVIVGDAPAFYRSTEIAEIKLEETYARSLRDIEDEEERWFTIELRDTDFTFNVTADAKLVGERAYRGLEQDLENITSYRLSKDRTRLGIKITNTFKHALDERGNIVLKGVEVVAARDARDGDVKAVIESKKLFDKEIITIAKRGEYKTKLSVADDWKYEVVAGNEKEVTFTLSEELANSLVGSRPVTFTFDQGVKINTHKNETSSVWEQQLADDILWGNNDASYANYINGLLAIIRNPLSATNTQAMKDDALAKLLVAAGNLPTQASDRDDRPGERSITGLDIITVKGTDVDEIDKGEWSDAEVANRVRIEKDYESFTVDNFNLDPDKAGKYEFTLPLLVPANVTGDIKVAVAGKGVNEEEIVILKAEAPVTVATTGMDIKVGLKEIETTGKITIKETAAERLIQGKDIVLRIDDSDLGLGLKIKSFKATVVEGDLVLGERKDTDRTINVKRSSTEPATIEITDIVMSTDRTVPEGKYALVVGGNAISNITGQREFYKNDHYDIDPVAIVKDFINITTKNTEDIAGSANKAEVGFVVGSDQYTINGKVETMDAPPYIKDGRTMVSIKYVAQALGVDADKVIWDQANQTATIIADKVVQVKLGNKAMVVNGVSLPMEVAAELTNDRTFVPMGSIARALGVVVEWDETAKAVTFNPKTK